MKIRKEFVLGLLQIKGLGRKSVINLIKSFSIDDVSNYNDLLDQIKDVRYRKLVKRLPAFEDSDVLAGIDDANFLLEKSENNGVSVVSYWENGYPYKFIEAEDPPLLIHYKGELPILNEYSGIAIIGTREPNPAGVKAGEFFGKSFAEKGFNIVSGLAKGCDSAGHYGALKANGKTTAILAHGLQTIYPKENQSLAEKIIDGGGVLLSEYPYGTTARPNLFVERDRLQADLSSATVVIQTAIKGGTMHAVNATIKSKKNLAAVQYSESELYFEKTFGNQKMIKERIAFPLSSKNIDEFIVKIRKSQISEKGKKIPPQTFLDL